MCGYGSEGFFEMLFGFCWGFVCRGDYVACFMVVGSPEWCFPRFDRFLFCWWLVIFLLGLSHGTSFADLKAIDMISKNGIMASGTSSSKRR